MSASYASLDSFRLRLKSACGLPLRDVCSRHCQSTFWAAPDLRFFPGMRRFFLFWSSASVSCFFCIFRSMLLAVYRVLSCARVLPLPAVDVTCGVRCVPLPSDTRPSFWGVCGIAKEILIVLSTRPTSALRSIGVSYPL